MLRITGVQDVVVSSVSATGPYDGFGSLSRPNHTCQMQQSSGVNSQGHRGEKLKAICDDFLALAQPSSSAHQLIFMVKGTDIVHKGLVREYQRKDQTPCACMCLHLCVSAEAKAWPAVTRNRQ